MYKVNYNMKKCGEFINRGNINNFRALKIMLWNASPTQWLKNGCDKMLHKYIVLSGRECHVVADMSKANFYKKT